MKLRSRLFNTKVFLLLMLSYLVFSCNNPSSSFTKTKKVKDDVSDIYVGNQISYLTSGTISSEEKILISLNKPIDKLKKGGDIIEEQIFEFSPEIDGKTYWDSPNSIVFIPDEPLENNKKYKAKANLSLLLKDVPEKYAKVDFDFSVLPLSLNVNIGELKPYKSGVVNDNYIEGSIMFSDVCSEEKAKQILSATLNNKELEIEYDTKINGRSLGFKVNHIKRSDITSDFILKWDGSSINSKSKGSISKIVYAVDKFKLTDVKINNSPDQNIIITFSDALNPSQNLNGLIYLNGVDSKIELNSNSITIYPETRIKEEVKLVVTQQIENYLGNKLESGYDNTITFKKLNPEVKFIDDGVIVPGNDKWELFFEAVNLKYVDIIVSEIYADNVKQFLQVNNLDGRYQLNRVAKVIYKEKLNLIESEELNNGEWNTFSADLSNIVKSNKKGSLYRISLRFKKEYAFTDCTNENAELTEEYNNSYYESEYYYPPKFRWYEREDPCNNSYYFEGNFTSKNFIPSKIALICKNNENKLSVFAADLITAEPMQRVEISVFNYQQQLIKKALTNADGNVEINLNKDELEEAEIVTAEYDGQFAYLKINGGNAVSYSRFDTKGALLKNGIRSFIYGERGVWRPGDTLFLTAIVSDNQSEIPKEHPASLKLYNPNQKLVKTLVQNKNLNGFYTFKLPTSADAQTGIWNVVFNYGGSISNKRIRIENIKPNRLKIKLSTNDSILNPSANKVNLDVKWLHGGDAKNLKAGISASIRPDKNAFPKYPDYVFSDPSKYFYDENIIVFDDVLDEHGNKSFTVKFPEFRRSPSMLKVNLFTKVFEKGGDFSVDQETKKLSPFKFYIGLKAPEPKNANYYLEVDSKHKFEVITVNEEGEKTDVENLKVEVFKLNWSWWYSYGRNSSSSYVRKNYDKLEFDTIIDTKNGKAIVELDLRYPSWGRYFVNVSSDDGHSTGRIVYFDWPSWYNRDDRKGGEEATILSLSSDKDEYKPGETAILSFPSPEDATVLVSLERNDRIIKSWWQKTEKGESTVKVKIDGEMTPNVYAYISVIQPYGKNINDMPIRQYGVLRLNVTDQNTLLKPVLDLPESVRPESTYEIKVSEENAKPMTYTIAVVDEGLLDLTKFRTPKPHKFFFAIQSLDVKTWDAYDLVQSAFGGNLRKTFAIGGSDDEENESGKKKVNRFKPVISFIGPFELKAGESKVHKLKMMNYIGSVKCMLIAGNNNAYGSTDKTMKVKQPLMVLATLPRKLRPKDKIKVPVSVFVMDEKIKSVKVNLESNEMLISGKNQKAIQIDGEGEYNLDFDVDVVDYDGVAKIKVLVESGKESAFYETEIEVKNPNTRIYKTENIVLKDNSLMEVEPEMFGQKNSMEYNINVSRFPSLNFEKRLKYLIKYPYGCIEQTTSSVFPQLYLKQLFDLNIKQKESVDKNIMLGIKRIQAKQNSNGGFGYWSYYSVSDWGTSYAGHFLILAKEQAYYVPAGMLSKWAKYQTKVSNNWNPQYYNHHSKRIYNDVNQAYRLYTLALYGKPNMGAMNRLREISGLNSQSVYMLAAAYALSGQKKMALQLIENQEYTPIDDYSYYDNYGSNIRDKALIVTALKSIDKDKAAQYVVDLVNESNSDKWMSTQTTAFLLSSLASFYIDDDKSEAMTFDYSWSSDKFESIDTESNIFSKDLASNDHPLLKIKNNSSNLIFAQLTSSGIPEIDASFTDINQGLNLDVIYKNLDNEEINPENLKQGTDFYAEVSIKNTSHKRLENIALSVLFPAGWEIINTRLFDTGAGLKSSDADYIDFKDDGVDFFFSMPRSNHTKTFRVLLNASYKGEYSFPIIKAGTMYDNKIQAVKYNSSIIVK